ncbi:MAG: arylesterase [Acidobacteriia bacterium]|nr:arylesterase [Terriglobia bacterium]
MKHLLLIFFLVLGACKEKSAPLEQTGSPAPAGKAPLADPRPAIVAFGDSLTAGHGVEPGSGWPELMQKELDQKGYAYRVVNAGVSGDTTSGGLARLDSVLEIKPKIVILELGGNDGLRGLPVASTRANLEEMIVALQGGGARVLLAGMTLPPNYGPAYIAQFETMYTDLAARHRLTLVPLNLEKLGTPTDAAARLMQADGIHPTAEGYRRLLPYLMKFVTPAL